MDALQLLKQEHQQVAELLKQGMQAKGSNERKQIMEKLEQMLKPHEQMEEKLFYPELRKKALAKHNQEHKEQVAEAYQEHHLVDVLLSEIKKVSPEGEAWLAKFTVLKENIEHHVQEEESRLFAQAKQAFNQEQLEDFADRMQAIKEQS